MRAIEFQLVRMVQIQKAEAIGQYHQKFLLKYLEEASCFAVLAI